MSIEIFNLQKERCKLAHLNVRGELHGEETVPAIDLKFEFDSANNVLSKLHPDLRAAFYRADDNRDLIVGDHLPALKFPLLDPTIGWDIEIPRVVLRVHADDGDLVLAGGKVNAFKLTLKEGGTVNWKFRAQFSDPNKEVLAALSGLLQQVMPITLESRDEEQEGDLFDQAEKQTQQPMSEARRKAEEEFAKAGSQVDTLPATGEVVFANDGTQPGDAGHSYATAPEGDPDFQEVKGAASAIPDPEQVETEPVSIVTPIGKGKRGAGRKVAGGSVE